MFSWAFVKEIRLATRACVVDVGNFLKVGPSVKRKTVVSKNNNIFCFHDLMISTFLFFSFKFGRSLFLRHFDEKYWNIGKFDFRCKIKVIGPLEMGKNYAHLQYESNWITFLGEEVRKPIMGPLRNSIYFCMIHFCYFHCYD